MRYRIFAFRPKAYPERIITLVLNADDPILGQKKRIRKYMRAIKVKCVIEEEGWSESPEVQHLCALIRQRFSDLYQ